MSCRFFSVALAISLILVGCGNSGRTLAQSDPPAPGPAAAKPASPAQTAAQVAPATPAPASLSEPQKIEKLLAAIEASRAIFIRNGEEHEAPKAVEHLRTKLKHAGKKVTTARDFIDKLASQSSMSGKPYEMKLPDGTKVPSREWLLAELARIETADQAAASEAAKAARTADADSAKGGGAADATGLTQDKVLAAVRESKLSFRRADTDAADLLSGPEMARHLVVKFVLSGAPALTGTEFIERFCTKAARPGTPYMVVLEDGSQRPMNEWLREQTDPTKAPSVTVAAAPTPSAG